jgi:hypothetical protein
MLKYAKMAKTIVKPSASHQQSFESFATKPTPFSFASVVFVSLKIG